MHRCPADSHTGCLAARSLLLKSSSVLRLERVTELEDTRYFCWTELVGARKNLDRLRALVCLDSSSYHAPKIA
jgi:hypothetical protein